MLLSDICSPRLLLFLFFFKFLGKRHQYIAFQREDFFLIFHKPFAVRCSFLCITLLLLLFVNYSVTTTTTMTNDENAGMVNDTKYNTAPCAQCGNMMTTFKVNSSQRHNDANQSSLSAGYHASSRPNVIVTIQLVETADLLFRVLGLSASGSLQVLETY